MLGELPYVRIARIDGALEWRPLGASCAQCLPTWSASRQGSFSWGSWSSAPVFGGWRTGACVENDHGDCVPSLHVAEQCVAAIQIDVALKPGAVALEGGSEPWVGRWRSFAFAGQCNSVRYWFADIYAGQPLAWVDRIEVTSACTGCQ
jgi:hypothetical protein